MFSSKKLAGFFVAVSLFGFALAPATRAASLTSSQVAAILLLLQSFGADAGTISNVSNALGAQISLPTGGSSPTNCPALSRNLSVGLQGDDVTSLQNFLMTQGDLASGSNTGYFGLMTQAAVQKWQSAHGISAVGSVGPQTRGAMGCGSNAPMIPVQTTTPVQTTNSNLFVSAVPTSGAAPLTAFFDTNAQGSSYAIDFGDGTGIGVGIGNCGVTRDQDCGESHTYVSPGTYVVKLVQGVTGCVQRGYGSACVVPSNASAVSTVTISVTGSATSTTPTATDASASFPSGYTPVQSCIDSQGSSCTVGCSAKDCGDPDASSYYTGTSGIYVWDSVKAQMEQIIGADPASFQEINLGHGLSFGVDKNHVYRGTTSLQGIDPHTFDVLWQIGHGGLYFAQNGSGIVELSDGGAVEDLGPIAIPNSDAASFTILSSGYDTNPYAKDKNNVYCNGSVIQGANPATATTTSGDLDLQAAVNGSMHTYNVACSQIN